MNKTRKTLPLSALLLNEGQLDWLPRNPRTWTKEDVERTAKSIAEDPDFLEDRPVLAIPFRDGKYIVFGGNLRREGSKAAGRKDVPAVVYVPESDDDRTTILRRAMKDNGSFGSWDYDALANEWDDLPLADFGIPVWEMEQGKGSGETEEEMLERRMREFREKLEAGEIREEDEEYQAFLEKFQAKKTTDDCFTPEPVYNAVVDWTVKEYGIKKTDIVRPFYPGGDYQKETYPKGCVVLDNPPFSILSEILKFYSERNIRFFLFAPTLTLFTSSSSSCTALPLSVPVTYENGANVNTSFLTNLEDPEIRLRSCPSLYEVVKKGNDENLKEMRREIPKYAYDHHIITAPFVGQLSRLGIDFAIPVAESCPISQLESQKESGKAIYGKGYIVGERVFIEREKAEREKAEREKAEREKAEREKAEREKAEKWELSPKEWIIVKSLTPNV